MSHCSSHIQQATGDVQREGGCAYLGRETETTGSKIAKLFLVVCKARAQTAKGERGTHDDRVADRGGGVECGVDGGDGSGLGHGDIDLCVGEWSAAAAAGERGTIKRGRTLEGLDEEIAVLGDLEGAYGGAEDADAETV